MTIESTMERGHVLELNPSGGNAVNFRKILEKERGIGAGGLFPSAPVADSDAEDLSGSERELGTAECVKQSGATSKRKLVDEYDYNDRFIDDDELRYEFERTTLRVTKYSGFYVNRGDVKLASSKHKGEKGKGKGRKTGADHSAGEVLLSQGSTSALDVDKRESSVEAPSKKKKQMLSMKQEKMATSTSVGGSNGVVAGTSGGGVSSGTIGGNGGSLGSASELPEEVREAVQSLETRLESTFGGKKPSLSDPGVHEELRRVFQTARAAGVAKLEGHKPGSQKRFVLDNTLWKHLSASLRCLRLTLESLGYTLHWTDRKEASSRAIESAVKALTDELERRRKEAMPGSRQSRTEARGFVDMNGGGVVDIDAAAESQSNGGDSQGSGPIPGSFSTSPSAPASHEKLELVMDDRLEKLIHGVLVARIEHLYDRNQLAQRPKKASKEMPGWLCDLKKRQFSGFAVSERALTEAYRKVEAVVDADRQERRKKEKEERRRRRQEELERQKERHAQRQAAALEKEKAKQAMEKKKLAMKAEGGTAAATNKSAGQVVATAGGGSIPPDVKHGAGTSSKKMKGESGMSQNNKVSAKPSGKAQVRLLSIKTIGVKEDGKQSTPGTGKGETSVSKSKKIVTLKRKAVAVEDNRKILPVEASRPHTTQKSVTTGERASAVGGSASRPPTKKLKKKDRVVISQSSASSAPVVTNQHKTGSSQTLVMKKAVQTSDPDRKKRKKITIIRKKSSSTEPIDLTGSATSMDQSHEDVGKQNSKLVPKAGFGPSTSASINSPSKKPAFVQKKLSLFSTKASQPKSNSQSLPSSQIPEKPK